jgi:hypothetical protein
LGQTVLSALATGLRFRIAMTIAAFAAFCLIAPPAVLAFGHGENTVHCLVNADSPHHGAHKTSEGTDQGAPSQHGTQAPDCCGLFCVSAIVPVIAGTSDGLLHGAAVFPQPEARFLGQPPGLPDRPPISLLFV